ncbi:unnamed protein product [Brassica oleracea]|uniref:(rape) hypothetical protein n=1 Tax=Brassica napus TaxID=3708 RepID=A0A816KB53_BRANA|nr:unnamed protein product [Brassica napus]
MFCRVLWLKGSSTNRKDFMQVLYLNTMVKQNSKDPPILGEMTCSKMPKMTLIP